MTIHRRDLPLHQRLTKGANVIELVKAVRARRGETPLVGIGPQAEELADARIKVGSWYPWPACEELLVAAHEQLFGGEDPAAVRMGIVAGTSAFDGVHKVYITPEDVSLSLKGTSAVWTSHFNFGVLEGQAEKNRYRAEIFGYDDVTRSRAHVIIGWEVAILQLCGISKYAFRVLSAPWLDGKGLVYELTW